MGSARFGLRVVSGIWVPSTSVDKRVGSGLRASRFRV